jgi:hypothetical protein
MTETNFMQVFKTLPTIINHHTFEFSVNEFDIFAFNFHVQAFCEPGIVFPTQATFSTDYITCDISQTQNIWPN